MKKKMLIVAVIIIILIMIIGVMMYKNHTQEDNKNNQIILNSVNFTMPAGFYEGTPNEAGDMNITDGNATIFIAKYGGTNITKFVKEYQNATIKNNHHVLINNFTLNNTLVYKAINTDSHAKHYWFIKDNNVYSIYIWHEFNNTDSIICDMIKSMG